MRKDVVIRDEFGRVRGRFERLAVTQPALRDACGVYGPGQYRVSWSEQKTVKAKNGKGKRKAVSVSKWIRIYEPDGTITPVDRGGIIVRESRQPDMSAFSAFLAEIKSGLDSMNSRLNSLEESFDEEDEEEEETPPTPPDAAEQIISIMRQPKYEHLLNALLISGDADAQAVKIDEVFKNNPTLPREIVLDIAQMILQHNAA